jgi:hypothetical protein
MRWMKKVALIAVLFPCLMLAGCAENPGNWPQDKVAAKIQEKLELSELSLAPNPEGGFTGTGKSDEGETFTIKITQDPSQGRLNWDSEGDRGTFDSGFYELK